MIRRLIGLALLASLFFTRFAAAGYVCPMELAYGPLDQNKVSRADCLNADGDQLALCANSFGDGRLWAGNNGHPPESDVPPAQEVRHPWLAPTGRIVPLQTFRSYLVVSAPIYLQTARLRL
ncbi:hypothetical protein CF70_029380 [Cupriavidus sp. SK-3]|uniref:hypothetical protein n=1 Tax=Cupriavidus sp. SK-3 TaxID=1470558 RepID=UPI0004507C43|nr:hypothetical protein [Cupriavidus sp. SK-3]KDP88617.1 hypothetical protein CF70_029380 [Cupriavidus sp. SK-3]